MPPIGFALVAPGTVVVPLGSEVVGGTVVDNPGYDPRAWPPRERPPTRPPGSRPGFARPLPAAARAITGEAAALAWAGTALRIAGRLSPWVLGALLVWEFLDQPDAERIPEETLGLAAPTGFYLHHACGYFEYPGFTFPQFVGTSREAGGAHSYPTCEVNAPGGSVPPFGDAHYHILQDHVLGGFFNVSRDLAVYWRDAGTYNAGPNSGISALASPLATPHPAFWPYTSPSAPQPHPQPVPFPLIPLLPKSPVLPEGSSRGNAVGLTGSGADPQAHPHAARWDITGRPFRLPDGPALPRPPEKGEFETKLHVGSVGGSAGAAARFVINAATETADAVYAIEKALPDRFKPWRRGWKADPTGRQTYQFYAPTQQEVYGILWKHRKDINYAQAVANLLRNHLEDQYWGKLNKKLRERDVQGSALGDSGRLGRYRNAQKDLTAQQKKRLRQERRFETRRKQQSRKRYFASLARS